MARHKIINSVFFKICFHTSHVFLTLLTLLLKSVDTATKCECVHLNPKTTLTPFLSLPCSSFPRLTPHPHPPCPARLLIGSQSVCMLTVTPLGHFSLSLDKPGCHSDLLNTQPLQKCSVKAAEITSHVLSH